MVGACEETSADEARALFYAATKHALAGYTEALRLEVAPLGVRVCLIEPAAHRTGILMSHPSETLPVYDAGRERVEAIIRSQIARGATPERVVDAIVRAATHRAPRFRYRVGTKAVWAGYARGLVPQALFEAVMRREFALPGS